MKIEQQLAKNTNQLETSASRQIFYDFGLILGSLGDPKITKNQEKSKPKKQQNLRSQKNTKRSEKRLQEAWPGGMRRPWGGLWGGKKTWQNWKNMRKKKAEVEAKDGEKNLQDAMGV